MINFKNGVFYPESFKKYAFIFRPKHAIYKTNSARHYLSLQHSGRNKLDK